MVPINRKALTKAKFAQKFDTSECSDDEHTQRIAKSDIIAFTEFFKAFIFEKGDLTAKILPKTARTISVRRKKQPVERPSSEFEEEVIPKKIYSTLRYKQRCDEGDRV
jgi:hypothetical protein